MSGCRGGGSEGSVYRDSGWCGCNGGSVGAMGAVCRLGWVILVGDNEGSFGGGAV